jgi:sugar phosphate isomerase/epimerase
MDCIRRDFIKLAFSGAATLLRLPGLAAAQTAIHGVKLGITTGSLNPLPDVPGKNRLDILVEECAQLECGNAELAAGFFGPALEGAAIGGQVPKTITPEYRKSREQLRQWRLSPAAWNRARDVRKKFESTGINLFSMSNTFADDVTDTEIDAMFQQMRELGIAVFQTNQTRVSMGPRLVPFVERYRIRPAFHTHAEVRDRNEVASIESLQRLMSLSAEFRICLDIGHFTAGNNDPVAYIREHHDRITHIHVKDRKRNGGPNVEWGAGDTPIRECLTLIRDNGYPIYCIVEREFQGTGSAMEQTRKDLEYMKEALA